MSSTKENDNFFEKVYAVARKIPYGRVTSYGAIAGYLGTRRSARMVGWAMNACNGREDVPAHRVVNRKGILTGKFHFGGTNLMQQLLESEGVEVYENQVVNFDELFWDPSEEPGDKFAEDQ
ncbi:MGMT family protein [Sinomicrobium soli]|uniref:MGMT family protein n=1 Tax=Sinomicrobium sp. N-1-3-6 TaxID=2219864 RepID=UPI000DCF3903|nr:MGMT family protein [Sinomicrobium sp. N-1-3-6]RAV30402.1 cysteine methyltransferase [Sinomicrobium sp. N-1-3-6]